MTTTGVITQRPHRASGMQRAWLCPPAPWREAAMPELEAGDVAEEGTLLHAAVVRGWKFGDTTGLEDDQRGAVLACIRLIHRLAQDAPAENLIFEQPIEVLDSSLEPIIDREVRPDLVIFRPGALAVVIDWKFGRALPQFAAGRDLQLLTYAIAVRNGYEGIDRVHVYRFHPRLWDENRETCVAYEGDDHYWRGREAVLKRIVVNSSPDAPASPGKAQCLYCKAKLVCEEFQRWAEPGLDELPAPINEAVTPAQLAKILAFKERLKLMNSMMEDAEQLAKKALARGIAIPGWTLEPGGSSRYIEDLAAAKKALAAQMPAEAFDSACKVSITKLEKAFKAATGLKGKAADGAFRGALAGIVHEKQSASSLARIAA